MTKNPLCEFCRHSTASYYKQDSGKAICGRCLFKYLQKRVKKELSELKLTPGAVVAAFIHPSLYIESLTLVNILMRIERSYNSAVIALVPRDGGATLDKTALNSAFIGVMSYVSSYPSNPYPSAVISDLKLVLKLIKEIGFKVNAVVTPLTLNDIALVALHETFIGHGLTLDLLGSGGKGGFARVVHAFKCVPRTDILAYAYLANLYREFATPASQAREDLALMLEEMINELTADHPELLFRLTRGLKSFSE